MTARQLYQETVGTTISISPSLSPSSVHLKQPRHRVMSIAPHDGVRDSHPPDGTNGSARASFITPRVLDQGAFDELSGRLEKLIAEAHQSVADLEARATSLRKLQEAPRDATTQLQERLRLGARMLKAFQGQIDLAQNSIADLQTQDADVVRNADEVKQTLQAFDQRLHDADLKFQQSLQQHVDAALETIQFRVDEQMENFKQNLQQRFKQDEERLEAEHDKRCKEIEELIQWTGSAQDKLNNTLRLVEAAEKNAASLSIQQVEAIPRIEQIKASVTKLVDQSALVRSELAEQLDQSEQRTAYFLQRGHTVHELLESAIHEGEAKVRDLSPLAELMKELTPVAEHLAHLLDKLEPWEQLLLYYPVSDEGIPQPVANMIHATRSGIHQEINTFSRTLRTLADQAENLLSHPVEMPGETVQNDVECPETAPHTPQDTEEEKSLIVESGLIRNALSSLADQ